MKPCTPCSIAVAAAALFATASATAQDTSSVQVYGIFDIGVEVNDTGAPGSSNLWLVNSGNMSATRLGFRGTEDLGGGLKALFNIEMGVALDTGGTISLPDSPGAIWGRRAVVGLQGAFGSLYLGRDYTPGFWTVLQTDRFRYGLPGTVSTPSQISATRANNGIFYNTPTMGGLTGRFAVALGSEGTTAAKDQGRLYSGSVDFRSGNLFLSAAVQRRRDLSPGSTTETTAMKEAGFGGEYKAGSLTFSAGYWGADPVTATTDAVTKSDAYWLGASLEVGVGVVSAQVAQTKLEVIGRGEGKATNFGLSYSHALSKRTNVYAAVGGVSNDEMTRLALNTGSQRVGGAVFGADPRAAIVGVRHTF